MTVFKISFRKAVFARNICIYGFSFNGFKTTMQSIDKIENTKLKRLWGASGSWDWKVKILSSAEKWNSSSDRWDPSF